MKAKSVKSKSWNSCKAHGRNIFCGKKPIIIAIALIVIAFIIGIYLYPSMPTEMASHWNINGDVDGHMSKFWGLFLMPIISVGLLLLFIFLPKIDPLKNNIEKFRCHYDWFITILVLFLFYLNLVTITWAFGYRFNIIQALAPAIGVLYVYIGFLLERTKRNWFIGIRTPWTLSHEKVWDETHKLGGKLFKIKGVIAFIGAFFGKFAAFFVVLPVIVGLIYTVIFSYFSHKKHVKKNRKKFLFF